MNAFKYMTYVTGKILTHIAARPPLVEDALRIWQAGVDAVRADRVMRDHITWDGRWLTIADVPYDLRAMDRLIVVGAGKASYGMLVGLLQVLNHSPRRFPTLTGWINVPEGVLDNNIADVTSWPITVFEARPQGLNEPTIKVVEGTQRILELVSNANSKDCVIALISGGGSALLCAPKQGVSFERKLEVTRALAACGADIESINKVRRCLSIVKAGGLARHCNAKLLITCVISDVLGDSLPFIASGPTLLNPKPEPAAASEVLKHYCQDEFQDLIHFLQSSSLPMSPTVSPTVRGSRCEVAPPHVLANNATAVDAAGTKAVELGYRYWMQSSRHGDGPADEFGRRFATQLIDTRREGLVDCLIHGGEPTVVLPPEESRGIGGRNQHLVLSAADLMLRSRALTELGEFVLLSGGTDGEDGPTDAAGAWIDSNWFGIANQLGINIEESLRRCDSNTVFRKTGHAIITGPSHTNVCDLRVALLGRTTLVSP